MKLRTHLSCRYAEGCVEGVHLFSLIYLFRQLPVSGVLLGFLGSQILPEQNRKNGHPLCTPLGTMARKVCAKFQGKKQPKVCALVGENVDFYRFFENRSVPAYELSFSGNICEVLILRRPFSVHLRKLVFERVHASGPWSVPTAVELCRSEKKNEEKKQLLLRKRLTVVELAL